MKQQTSLIPLSNLVRLQSSIFERTLNISSTCLYYSNTGSKNVYTGKINSSNFSLPLLNFLHRNVRSSIFNFHDMGILTNTYVPK